MKNYSFLYFFGLPNFLLELGVHDLHDVFRNIGNEGFKTHLVAAGRRPTLALNLLGRSLPTIQWFVEDESSPQPLHVGRLPSNV